MSMSLRSLHAANPRHNRESTDGSPEKTSSLSARPWTLVAVVVVLIAAHGFAFYFLRHLALSVTLASGLIILIVVKHLGMFSSVYAVLRKRLQKNRSSQ